jgi:hypothetical protein
MHHHHHQQQLYLYPPTGISIYSMIDVCMDGWMDGEIDDGWMDELIIDIIFLALKSFTYSLLMLC